MNDLLDFGITVNAGFFAPAGLDLGAETPEEIALSIVSEIQRVFAKDQANRCGKEKYRSTQLWNAPRCRRF
jgi:xanthine/CO dehydrogenase XdhC/CoxF family maturation factor